MHQRRQKKTLELLDSSGARLHGLLARLTLCEDAAGDLLQELFIKLSGSNGFDKAQDPFAYAYRVVVNLAFDWRKKHKVKFQSLDETCLSVKNDSSGALTKMIQDEELQQTLDAVAQLNELARQVVVLRYLEQLSYEEIARRLSRKPQYLRSVCAKALGRLRKLMAEEKSYSIKER